MRIAAWDVFRLRIPFRFAPRRPEGGRRAEDNIIVRLVLEDGTAGYGEGAPREAVTGETVESAARMIAGLYAPEAEKIDPVSFGEAAWAAAGLRVVREGRTVHNAARCAVELALLDAYGKAFGAGMDALKESIPGIGGEGGSSAAPLVASLPRLGKFGSRAAFLFFRIFGFRSFKVTIGAPSDKISWSAAASLARKTRRGRFAIVADAEGAWTAEEAPGLIARLARLGFASVEQPVPAEDLAVFARSRSEGTGIEVTADESFRTAGEAERLAAGRACDGLMVGLSKCGGLFPSLQVVEVARRHGLRCRLGAAEGETGILSAAQGFFREIAPGFVSVEPSFSRLFLRPNIVRRPPGLGGLAGFWPRSGCGLGVRVDEKKFQDLTEKLCDRKSGAAAAGVRKADGRSGATS